jgi:hypothetical protein
VTKWRDLTSRLVSQRRLDPGRSTTWLSLPPVEAGAPWALRQVTASEQGLRDCDDRHEDLLGVRPIEGTEL